MENADPETFEVIAKLVAKDKNRAYIGSEIFEGVDHKNMESLWGSYFKDSGSVYFDSQRLKGADPTVSWMQAEEDILDTWLISDSLSFFLGSKVTGLNSTKVRGLKGSFYSLNEDLVFFGPKILPNAYASSFDVRKKFGAVIFGFDQKNVYIKYYLVKEADPKSFKLVENSSNFYFVDDQRVYYSNERDRKLSVVEVVGADAKTFKIRKLGDSFAFDKNYIYKFGMKIENSDSKSFKELNHAFSVDKNNIYRYEQLVVGLDREVLINADLKEYDDTKIYFLENSFPQIDKVTLAPKNLVEELSEGYSKFNSMVFSGPYLVTDADHDSFQVIGTNMAKDINYVYFYTSRVKNLDPKTFQFVEGIVFSDEDDNGFVSAIEK
ncbi:MAG: DKNYY domain-containing protein [Bdellovibrionales bacterium]